MSLSVRAAEIFTVADVAVTPGGSDVLRVVCQLPEGTAWRDAQIDIVLPDNVSVPAQQDGRPEGLVGSAAKHHSLMANYMGEGRVRYLLFSSGAEQLTDGELLTIPLNTSAQAGLGDMLTGSIENTSLSTAAGQSVKGNNTDFHVIVGRQVVVPRVSVEAGQVSVIRVMLAPEQGQTYRDFQCDLLLPSQLTTIDGDDGQPVAYTGEAADKHTLMSRHTGEGLARFILFSAAGKSLDGGVVMEIPVMGREGIESGQAEGWLCNIRLSDAKGNSVNVDDREIGFDLSGLPTGINATDSGLTESSAYDLNGRKQQSDKSLHKGVYIIDGKKTILK